ncbi:hypothetical protein ACN28S_52525 [Cystobacter fuscus]
MSRDPKQKPPTTPDGRYFVMKGVLWRCSDPGLGPKQRALLVEALMHARRDVGRALRAGDSEAERRRAPVSTRPRWRSGSGARRGGRMALRTSTATGWKTRPMPRGSTPCLLRSRAPRPAHPRSTR